MLVCLQAVAREGPEAVSVRLGALSGHSQAQLDGFKSRALRARAPTQRHLYATEWRQAEVAGGVGAAVMGRLPSSLLLPVRVDGLVE